MKSQYFRNFCLGLWILFFIAWGFSATGQTAAEEKANRLAGKGKFSKAAKWYDELANQQEEEWIIRGAAQCYFFSGDYSRAIYWYSRLDAAGHSQPDDVLHHAQSYLFLGDTVFARKLFRDYSAWPGKREQASRWLETLNRLPEFKQDSALVSIRPMAYNSRQSEFGAWPLGDGGVLLSRSGQSSMEYVISEHLYFPFPAQIYSAHPPASGKTQPEISPMPKAINRFFQVGPALLSADGNCLYFTVRSEAPKQSSAADTAKVRTSIFFSIKENGKWKRPSPLFTDSKGRNEAHPSFSSDGKTCYFSSDRPGGMGGIDIWMATQTEAGWGNFRNAGPNVNSSGEEGFAYCHPSGTLFFSSNGRTGMGGFDIFQAEITDAGFQEAQNLGYPINSSFNDFSLVFDKNRPSGYFSSDRPGGSGGIDLYTFKRKIRIRIVTMEKVNGSLQSLSNVEIKLGLSGSPELKMISGGVCEADLEWGRDYQLIAAKEGYVLTKQSLKTFFENPFQPQEIRLVLEAIGR